MISQTPQFDVALDKILETLVPHTKKCLQGTTSKYCMGTFSITAEDIAFYKMLRVPPPQLCPVCRRQRRQAFGYVMKFYKQTCQAPGHGETTISFVPPKKPFIIYDWEYYNTYVWDPFSYGRAYDSSRPFFDFFFDMRKQVPQPAFITDPSSVNSKYSLNGRNLKNGYYVSGGWHSENVSYCKGVTKSSDSVDCFQVLNVHHSYENFMVTNASDCDFLYFSNDCLNSQFLHDCRGCSNCFGCVNLRHKSFCFFNEQLSEEEYNKKMDEVYVGSRTNLKKYQEKFWNLVKTLPIRVVRIEKSENVSGNYIINSKDCFEVYTTEKSQNIRFADETIGNKDSMDYAISGGSELLYETVAVGSQSSRVKFTFMSKFITESEFLINCRYIEHCFGCIGLENKKFCIFNVQYSEDDYWKKVDEIKTDLLEKGEYGEFFPLMFSSQAYNNSRADSIFPLEQKEVEALGGLWQEEVEIDTGGLERIAAHELPDDIKDVSDDILNKAIICEVSGWPFRIIASELEFYRRKKIPLPTKHPYQRILERTKIVNNFRVFPETCEECNKNIQSIYKREDGFRPYCEECYQQEVI